MNIPKLLDAVEYLSTQVKPENFDMGSFRSHWKRVSDDPNANVELVTDMEDFHHICRSVGCAVGHLTALDPKSLKAYRSYRLWSEAYFGLSTDQWIFLFAGKWKYMNNTIQGVIDRITYLIDNKENIDLSEFIENKDVSYSVSNLTKNMLFLHWNAKTENYYNEHFKRIFNEYIK